MVPGKLRLEVYKGSTYRYKIQLKQFNNTPIDLSGCTVAMQVRPHPGSDTLLYDLGENNCIRVFDALAGEIEIDIPASTSAAFDFVSGFYDILVSFPNGDTFRVLEGVFDITLQVTRVS